jgi:hypothetical protein
MRKENSFGTALPQRLKAGLELGTSFAALKALRHPKSLHAALKRRSSTWFKGPSKV